MTVREARAQGREALAANTSVTRSPTPALDADVLLCFVLGCDKTKLLFDRDRMLSEEEEARFTECITRRNTGLPVAYIMRHKEFFGYDFYVTPAVLIPKPDTELLVEEALSAMRELSAAVPQRAIALCDMCTGSGCVALSILRAAADRHLFPQQAVPRALLADISEEALSVARKNKDALFPGTAQNISMVQSDLFGSVQGTFDIITANPPYIPAAQVRELLKDGRSEPELALDGDSYGTERQADGLSVMRCLVPQATEHLAPGGVLLVESGEYNAEETERLFRAAGLRETRIARDLAGDLRVVIGKNQHEAIS